MQQRKELYKGKSKTVYDIGEVESVLVEFRNDATAFNAIKHAILAEKGKVNCAIDAFIMQHLMKQGIKTHWIRAISETEILAKRLDMLRVECIIRNRAAGSICKRLGLERGRHFSPPLFEFFLKDDALGDPLITEDHILLLNLATVEDIALMKALSYRVNDILCPLFLQAGLELVDFKLEFGRYHGELLLGDEFTLDGCRLWDKDSGEIYDKDRFRQDLGNVIEFYKKAADRLGIVV